MPIIAQYLRSERSGGSIGGLGGIVDDHVAAFAGQVADYGSTDPYDIGQSWRVEESRSSRLTYFSLIQSQWQAFSCR